MARLIVTVKLEAEDRTPIGSVTHTKKVTLSGDLAGPATRLAAAIVGGQLFELIRRKAEAHEVAPPPVTASP